MGEDDEEQKAARVRALLGDVTLIIVDEVHAQFNRQGYRALCAAYPEAHHIGLSGTPYLRKPSQYLGQFYDGVICGPQPEQLIQDGVVLPEVAYAPSCLSEASLEIGSDGEFTIGSQEIEALKPLALNQTVDAYMERAKGIPCGVYAVSVAHAELLAAAFRERFLSERECWGWGVEVQTGNTPIADRAHQFDRFNTGKTRVIVSVGTMATGCDLPAMGCVIVAKSINSRALYLQIAGRGSRVLRFEHPCYPEGKKLFVLITMSDKTLPRFGVPSGYQDYDIGPRAVSDKAIDMTKKCPECEAVILKTAPICPHCGYVFGSEPGDGLDEDLEDRPVIFSPFLSGVIKKHMKKYRAAIIEALRADTDPWAAREDFKTSSGTDFGAGWCEGLIFGSKPTETDRLVFSGYLARHCSTATGRGHLYRAEFGSAKEAARSPWAYLGLNPTATHDQAIAAFRAECVGVTPDRRDLLSIALGQILGQQPQRVLTSGGSN
jgi:hypothetical protein